MNPLYSTEQHADNISILESLHSGPKIELKTSIIADLFDNQLTHPAMQNYTWPSSAGL